MDDENKKQFIKDAILIAVEIVDDKIPIIGPMMDFDSVDLVERALVNQLVDTVYNNVPWKLKRQVSRINDDAIETMMHTSS